MVSGFIARYDLADCKCPHMVEDINVLTLTSPCCSRSWFCECGIVEEVNPSSTKFSEIYLLQTGSHGSFHDTDAPAVSVLILQRGDHLHKSHRVGVFRAYDNRHVVELVTEFEDFDQSVVNQSLPSSILRCKMYQVVMA